MSVPGLKAPWPKPLPDRVPAGKSINAPKTPQHTGGVRGAPRPVKRP